MKKWQCTVCGYIHQGDEPPQKCPVCGADKDKFVELTGLEMNTKEENQQVDTLPGEEKKAIMGIFAQLAMKNHLHPVSVHSPNGIIPVALIFFTLALLFDSQGLARAAYYNLIAALISMPVVLYSGYIAWKSKYNGAKTMLFMMKMLAGAASTIILFVLVIWRTVQSDTLADNFSARALFWFWLFILFLLVALAGHLGGKLVFKK